VEFPFVEGNTLPGLDGCGDDVTAIDTAATARAGEQNIVIATNDHNTPKYLFIALSFLQPVLRRIAWTTWSCRCMD
jgi:hypothetical protein